MELKETIRQRRKELGLSQRELSRRSGVRVAAISEFETGKKDLVTRNLVKIMAVLDLSIETTKISKSSNGKE